jgi:hypothetical protein
MRKEIWFILLMLGVIYGVIFLFSTWNKKNLGKKRKIRRNQQIVTCKNIASDSALHGFNWSEEECRRDIVGMGHSQWKKLISCQRKFIKKEVSLKLLQCIGHELCDLGKNRGCLIKGRSLLKIGDEKSVEKGRVILEKQCRSKNGIACNVLKKLYSKIEKGSERLDMVLSRLCDIGDVNACKDIKKDPLIEKCSIEDVEFCVDNSTTSQDVIVHFLACSYGKGESCRKFSQLISGGIQGIHSSSDNPFLLESCFKGDYYSCGVVGKIYQSTFVAIDACKNGDTNSCVSLIESDIGLGRKRFLMNRLCRQGQERWCQILN